MSDWVADVDPDVLGDLTPGPPDLFGRPIVTRHVGDEVAERLVTAIALGVYVPGQRLPSERDLAPMLGVSRTTVRDAMRALTSAGYLQVRRGRNGGYFVLADWGPSSAEMVRRHLLPNWAQFEQLFDARTLIEPLIAATAAARRTSADCEVIIAALHDYRAAVDREASRQADERLHRAVAQATHNTVLLGISTRIRSKMSLNLGAEPYTEQVRRAALEQHLALAHAVIDGDAGLAGSVAGQHFMLSEKLIRQLVARVQAQGESS